ncbi:hypothetical protein [Spirosoma sp.]|uniref:hypothetical protein n=1 Tax=Spirosoma sp. TaxID=1899569 RepID=UPI00261E6418|nr:hypothetical protein [Spirosoma sp.]MCX6216241.1 hypothetical protein [Spirosoma sp.]
MNKSISQNRKVLNNTLPSVQPTSLIQLVTSDPVIGTPATPLNTAPAATIEFSPI